MNEMQENPADDSVALNSMMNTVRAQRLHSFRSRCLANWRKRECSRMKLKTIDMKTRHKQLKINLRKLEANFNKDGYKRGNVEAPMMRLLMSMKATCVERNKRVEALKTEMAPVVARHRALYDRAQAFLRNTPRMARLEDLRKEAAAVKEEWEQLSKESEEKRLTVRKEKEIFNSKCVKFANMVITMGKIEELRQKNKELYAEFMEKSKEPGNELNEGHCEFPGINFGIFDVELDESDDEPCPQESMNGDGDFELNCSALSLGMSEIGVGLTFGSSLGAPVAASTPNEEAEQNPVVIMEEEQKTSENAVNPEQVQPVLEEPMMVNAEAEKEDDVHEVQDMNEKSSNCSEDIDYRAKYAKSPENLPLSAATSPQAAVTPVSTGFNFLSSVQEVAGAGVSLFGFGPAEPSTSSIFNLF